MAGRRMERVIYVDSNEPDKIFDYLVENTEEEVEVKRKSLGSFDCEQLKIVMEKPNGDFGCYDEDKIIKLENAGFSHTRDKSKCKDCEHRVFIQWADFALDNNRGAWERKKVSDALNSRNDGRIYEQLNKIDTWMKDNKGLILEGDTELFGIQDSHDFWKRARDGIKKMDNKSPLSQLAAISSKGFAYSLIRECKQRKMDFTQTYDWRETCEYIIWAEKGIGTEPKIRYIPKRHKKVPLMRDILMLFGGVGKSRSKKILESDPVAITTIRKLIKHMKSYGFITE